MKAILKEVIKGKKVELIIDTTIFPKEIILKAAFNHLDTAYFFFSQGKEEEFILQLTTKAGTKAKPADIVGEFSDTLLEVYLRDKLEKQNKVIREAIITRAMTLPLDNSNFVSINTDDLAVGDGAGQQNQNQIDFDKDIDEILKEIENDPELKIDEGEIEKILKEIEEEEEKIEKPSVKVDLEGLKKAKKAFKK